MSRRYYTENYRGRGDEELDYEDYDRSPTPQPRFHEVSDSPVDSEEEEEEQTETTITCPTHGADEDSACVKCAAVKVLLGNTGTEPDLPSVVAPSFPDAATRFGTKRLEKPPP